jgi:hypothetical protein
MQPVPPGEDDRVIGVVLPSHVGVVNAMHARRDQHLVQQPFERVGKRDPLEETHCPDGNLPQSRRCGGRDDKVRGSDRKRGNAQVDEQASHKLAARYAQRRNPLDCKQRQATGTILTSFYLVLLLEVNEILLGMMAASIGFGLLPVLFNEASR